jgi:5-enolpyruvylshikimate-3-phosphate synthase
MRALGMASEYVKATNDVEPLDHFDVDVAMPEVIDIMGAPIEWTRTIEAVQARRDARAKALEQQQMLDAAPAAAAMAKTMQTQPQAAPAV